MSVTGGGGGCVGDGTAQGCRGGDKRRRRPEAGWREAAGGVWGRGQRRCEWGDMGVRRGGGWVDRGEWGCVGVKRGSGWRTATREGAEAECVSQGGAAEAACGKPGGGGGNGRQPGGRGGMCGSQEAAWACCSIGAGGRR
ncbi:hypothetical protein K439DRAFT_1621558 [Ramaria rubella]|nr:hypothetical protein K439DRAFT_1621558 [Ramaria rubella]